MNGREGVPDAENVDTVVGKLSPPVAIPDPVRFFGHCSPCRSGRLLIASGPGYFYPGISTGAGIPTGWAIVTNLRQFYN